MGEKGRVLGIQIHVIVVCLPQDYTTISLTLLHGSGASAFLMQMLLSNRCCKKDVDGKKLLQKDVSKDVAKAMTLQHLLICFFTQKASVKFQFSYFFYQTVCGNKL